MKHPITIRLYKTHDLDLIALRRNQNFPFIKAIIKCLQCYATNKKYFFQAPVEKFYDKNIKSLYEIRFLLDDEKYPEIFELLSKLRNRQRNAFIKNLLRYYIVNTDFSGFFNDVEDIFIQNKEYESVINKYNNFILSKENMKSFKKNSKNNIAVNKIEKSEEKNNNKQIKESDSNNKPIVAPIRSNINDIIIKNNKQENIIKNVTINENKENISVNDSINNNILNEEEKINLENETNNNEESFDFFNAFNNLLS